MVVGFCYTNGVGTFLTLFIFAITSSKNLFWDWLSLNAHMHENSAYDLVLIVA
jgi:hypothetical protein